MTDTKILSKKTVFQSTHFLIENVVLERQNQKISKDFIRRLPIAIIIPFTQNNEIYLESQHRDVFEKTMLEIVAGHLEPDEDPLLAAKRELQEETGITAKEWQKIATWKLSSNIDQTIHVFCATDLTMGEQQLDDDEAIKVVKMPLSEVVHKIENGEISVGFHIAAFLLFDKLRKEGKL